MDDENDQEHPDELAVLRMIVEAHAQPDPNSGTREPIYYIEHFNKVSHHAISGEQPYVDDALVHELHVKNLISINYSGPNTQQLTPTQFGRETIERLNRVSADATADVAQVVQAFHRQAAQANPMAWPAIRPVLEALRDYWQASGYPAHGIGFAPIVQALPDEAANVFGATLRALSEGGYLSTGALRLGATLDDGTTVHFPLEAELTEKARSVLDGWPGATPTELVENLLAVLAFAAENEPDPERRGRLERFLSAAGEVGVSVGSEVMAKVITGGMGLG
jgi:hypothetical protein